MPKASPTDLKGVPASMLAGDGCKKCGTKTAHINFVKDQSEFEEQVRKVNPDIDVIGDGGDASHHYQHSAQFVICEVEGVAETRLLLHSATLQIIDDVECCEKCLGNGCFG